MKLVIPEIKYKDSFLEAMVEETQATGKCDSVFETADSIRNNFTDYVQTLIDRSQGKRLPPGWVPETRYWIVDNNEYIGDIGLRHELTPGLEKLGGHIDYGIKSSKRKMGYGTMALKMLLPKAAEQGFKKVLITCDDDNIGSIKIIERNGGVLQDKIQNPDKKMLTRRYWLNLNRP